MHKWLLQLRNIFLLLLLALSLTHCAHKPPTLHTEDDQVVEVRLEGVNQATIAQAFGKVLRAAEGVIEAKRYATDIVVGNPQKSYALWLVTTSYADPFRLDESILDGIKEVLRHGGRVVINGVNFDYSPADIEMFKGIQLLDATANDLRYIVDRELARDRDFSGRLNPYTAQ